MQKADSTNFGERSTEITSEEIIQPTDKQAEEFHLMNYTNPKTKEVTVMPQAWSVASLTKNILGYLENQNVMRWLSIGKSSSGKSTLTARVLHQINDVYHRNFVIKWYSGQDLLDMPKIVRDMEKNRDHIIVFDDASYTLEDAPKKKVGEMANVLTEIRHIAGEQSKFLLIFNIHQSKATLKKLREAEMITCLSLTQNDKYYLQTEFFDEMAVRKFGKMYRDQCLKGYFEYMYNPYTSDTLQFHTDRVHIGLVNLLGRSSFFLFDKLDCERCNKSPYYKPENEQYLTATEFLDRLNMTYNQADYATVLRFLAFWKTGNDQYLNANHRKTFRLISKLLQKTNLNIERVLELMETKYIKKRSKHKWSLDKEHKTEKILHDKIDSRIEDPNKFLTKSRENSYN